MKALSRAQPQIPTMYVDVHEPGVRVKKGYQACLLGEHLKFSTDELSSYFLNSWQEIVFDALLVAAAVEFCDRSQSRPLHYWMRDFILRIPVHDPGHWNRFGVKNALYEALSFLTGDRWQIEFVHRKKKQMQPMQSSFEMPSESRAIIPFSEGMDSLAVAGLMSKQYGQNQLVRVRLGPKVSAASSKLHLGEPFTSVPYSIHPEKKHDSSARSRGFKFATISGLSAYLANVETVIVPESGQGALGPALIPVGQTYQDYRNHPLFTARMSKYFGELLNYKVSYKFPRIWQTKGETLRDYVAAFPNDDSWAKTKSCWQQARQASVSGTWRQCGICAACMLRRLSVHAAGLVEDKAVYVWENLSASSFSIGANKKFEHMTRKLYEYAIAGVLHLDHLASLQSTEIGRSSVDLCAFQLSTTQGLNDPDARQKLNRLLNQHENEWRSFLSSLKDGAFILNWAAHIK